MYVNKDELKQIINDFLHGLYLGEEALNALVEVLKIDPGPEDNRKETVDSLLATVNEYKKSLALMDNTIDKLRLYSEYSGFDYHWV